MKVKSTSFLYVLFFFFINPVQVRGQLFAALEIGTELNNTFHDLQNGLTQPYWMSARLHAGVIVNRWRMGVSESGFFTNPGSTHMEGAFLQYGIELVEIDGAKLIDLYLGVEAHTQLIQNENTHFPIGILASTTLPSIVDLSVRTGYDFNLDRYYLGISLGRSISRHTRPAGEKIPYPTNYSDCQYVVFNQTQVPLQTLFHKGPENPEEVIEQRFTNLRTFSRPHNESAFVSQPSVDAALFYMESMALPELANAFRLGLERSKVHQACEGIDLSSRTILNVLWRRLSDTFILIRDARK